MKSFHKIPLFFNDGFPNSSIPDPFLKLPDIFLLVLLACFILIVLHCNALFCLSLSSVIMGLHALQTNTMGSL